MKHSNSSDEFNTWLASVKDKLGKAKILQRIRRATNGTMATVSRLVAGYPK